VHGAVSICPLTDLTFDFRRKGGSLDGAAAAPPGPPYTNSYVTRVWDEASRTGDPIFTDSHGDFQVGIIIRTD
jgi:hypothetical protein